MIRSLPGLLVAACLALTSVAHAGDAPTRTLVAATAAPSATGPVASISWVPPTTVPAASITGYKIYSAAQVSGACPTVLSNPVTVAPSAVAGQLTVTYATWCFAVTTLAYGLESVYSNIATHAYLQPPPDPPTGVTATAQTAYDFVKTPGAMVAIAVGTVPADVVCNTSQSVNGLYAVPVSAVNYLGTARPLVVYAKCS